jgi:radical SAM protein with 4Fe4S-binding SPASM domain
MTPEKRKACLLPWTHMYYHNDKGVYPCCKLAGLEKFKLGNSSDSLEQLWNSKVLKSLRKDIINKTEPEECFYHCFNNINPLHVYLPEEYQIQQEQYFEQTAEDGSSNLNFVIWNINESNICNFKCMYCCSEFSNQFDRKLPIRKSFDNQKDMLELFESNINKIEKLFLSSGESYMQPGYYKMLEIIHMFKSQMLKLSEPFNTLHLAEGPGGFMECIHNVLDDMGFRDYKMYGMTLIKDEKSVPSWKRSNFFFDNNPNVKIIFGCNAYKNYQ